MIHLAELSRERRKEVNELITSGSDPKPRFFVLVALSTLIAALGLIMNSTAVVIGAMLVAPLMLPILGVALALVQGNSRLLGLAMRAEVVGLFLAVLVSALLGFAIPYFDVTSEMLSRTQPNLLDLGVAVFAGLAGAYAMVDEVVSPALPGVAISTAIVPPLANAGLCLALGSYSASWGSFLLFLTNFVSILLAAAFVFALSGLTRTRADEGRMTVVRRFSIVVVGFLVVGVFLTSELSRMVGARQRQHIVRTVLTEELPKLRVSELTDIEIKRMGDGILAVASINAPRTPSPREVQRLENRIEEAIGEPIELFLRTSLARNVSSVGSIGQHVRQTLDGFEVAGLAEDHELGTIAIAEQVMREYIGTRFGLQLKGMTTFDWPPYTAILAQVGGIRQLRSSEIALLEEQMSEATGGEPIQLGIIEESDVLHGSEGTVRTEFAMRRPKTPDEQSATDAIDAIVRAAVAERGYAITAFSRVILGGTYTYLVEVSGPQLFSSDELEELYALVDAEIDVPVELYVRSVPESVVSRAGPTTLDALLANVGERTREEYESETQALIDSYR